jgi:hypothetical protein
VLSFAVLFPGVRSEAQFGTPFVSGSTGTDGALNITTPGVTYFDPKALKLTPGTNIFNFTTIAIAAGSTLMFSERVFHGPVFFLASGDVTINGTVDLDGESSLGPTATAAEQTGAFAGSGGYSGGLGGIHGDANHQALPGNGPGGGAAGDINSTPPQAVGGSFSANRFLVPLVGGSGGGGTNDNSQYGAQGGAGGGAILIASSTKITLDGPGAGNGLILARGGSGGVLQRGCGGSGGAVRLIANTVAGANNYGIFVDRLGVGSCSVANTNGLARVEANNISYSPTQLVGAGIFSVPYVLNLPNAPLAAITVISVNGIPINANPFSFPDATINTSSPVAVVISATNVPLASTVKLYVVSDLQPNQSIPVTLTGNDKASTATVNVTFGPGGSRGFVKAVFQ